MLLESPYTDLKKRKDSLLNTGYDYKGNILDNSMSSNIIRKTGMFREYLDKIDNIVYELIEHVKQIKVFANAALDKNERRII